MPYHQFIKSVKQAFHSVALNTYLYNVSGRRFFADKPKKIDTKSKQIMVKSTATKHGLVTRRVRPTDVPRVLKFMREQTRRTTPGKTCPEPAQTVHNDYISRILAQGHTMLTEQLEIPYGWGRIRGLALATGYTPWDAIILDSFSQCIKSLEAKKLIKFSAHCLRAPGLHEKYKVHNVLQVILVVPENQDSKRVANALVKGILQRGRDVGFPVVRFDANTETIVKTLEYMNLKKEWHMNYEVLPTKIIEKKEKPTAHAVFAGSKEESRKCPFISVYTAIIDRN